MIIDGFRFGKYLKDTGLMAEEFYLLYRIMMQEQNMIDGLLKVHKDEKESAIKLFSQWSEEYQQTHKTYLNTNIDYLTILDHLEEKEFVLINIKLKDRLNLKAYKLKDISVTDKFRSYFLMSDVKQAYYEFVDIYPRWVVVKGNRFPSNDLPEEELVELYSKHILKGGNKLLHERCLLITKRYLDGQDSKSAPYGQAKYMTEKYEGIALNIENEASLPSNYEEA